MGGVSSCTQQLSLSPAEIPPLDGCWFDELPDEVMVEVFSFLPPRYVCIARAVAKRFDAVAANYSPFLWRPLLCQRFGLISETYADAQALYIQQHLAYLNSEIKHMEAVAPLMRAIQIYSKKSKNGGIIGLLSNLIKVDDEQLAQVLSRKRRAAMMSLVVRDGVTVHEFRAHSTFVNPISFLPLDAAIAGGYYDESSQRSSIDSLPQIDAPGFMGYAVQLVQLPAHEESLRRSILWTVFKDLMVFRTVQDAEVYARAGHRPWYVALDTYSPRDLVAPCHMSCKKFRDPDMWMQRPDELYKSLQQQRDDARRSLAHVLYGR